MHTREEMSNNAVDSKNRCHNDMRILHELNKILTELVFKVFLSVRKPELRIRKFDQTSI